MNANSNRALQALGRLKTGVMNRMESEYDRTLAARKFAGEIVWYRFEGMKFRLADNTFFSPDFAVMLSTGEIQIHEVKGFMQEDANIKLKVAADMYPMAFFIVRARNKKNGGGWDIQEIGNAA